MNPVQSEAFDNEIALAKEFIARGEFDAGYAHLERAHVIGQAFVARHLTHGHSRAPGEQAWNS